MRLRWASSIAALLALTAWHSSQAQGVQVYRCTAADGSVALQDSPCAQGADQQLRTLKRPPDAAPSTPVATPETPAPPEAPEPESESAPAQVAAATQFECITHDGQTYRNETGIGEMRWVPLWVIGMDPNAPARTFQRTGAKPSAPRTQPRAPSNAPGTAALGAGTWIRDTCYQLSPERVCDHRRDRLAELRKRRRLAQASERVMLDAEFDQLSAQFAAECR